MDKLKFVKLVVFVITFLLIFGTMLLLTRLYKKGNVKKWPEVVSLGQPEGSVIKKITDANRYLYMHIAEGGKSDRVVVIDAEKGKIISTIVME